MSEHKHHHHKDSASLFKEKSLAAIQRRKTIGRVLKMSIIVIAVIMAILVMLAYTIG